jgi:hypothetical protein
MLALLTRTINLAVLDHICHYVRVRRFPYHTRCTLDRGDGHHHELGYLYLRTTIFPISLIQR